MRSKVNPYPFHPGKMKSVTFPERLLRLIAAGKSQRQVADRLGISHTQLARYLAGQQPTLDRAADIATRLEITLDELAGRVPDRKRRPLVVSVDGELYVPVSAARAEQLGGGLLESEDLAPDLDEAAELERRRRGEPLPAEKSRRPQPGRQP